MKVIIVCGYCDMCIKYSAIVMPYWFLPPLQQGGVLCVVCGEEVVQSVVHRSGIQIVRIVQ